MTASAAPVEAGTSAVRPSRAEAEAAVRTLIRWAGDDPGRSGLLDTPDRVLRSFDEAYSGYRQDPTQVLEAGSVEALDQDLVVVRGIRFASRSDENMVPLIGDALVAYLPVRRALEASALGAAVDVLSRRLQSSGALAALLAAAIHDSIRPLGAAVLVRSVRVGAMMSPRSTEAAMMVDVAYSGTLRQPSPWHPRLATLILNEPPIRVGPGRNTRPACQPERRADSGITQSDGGQ